MLALTISFTASAIAQITSPVKVNIQADKQKAFLAPRALGVNWLMSGHQMTQNLLPEILASSGVTTLRYPGGSYADSYHWSTNALSGAHANVPALGPDTDFGHFAKLLDRIGGTAVITVNYGSNLDASGGGTPEEAAAWVAYAMGDPGNSTAIGNDAAGHDWKTIGYWASLRTAQPLPNDDGLNFLRIEHPAPILIKFWEIGNEVYKNGYYDGNGSEQDLHASYGNNAKESEKERHKNQNLSPEAYGRALLQYEKAMKAVDNRIKVGASLDVPLPSDWNTSGDWVQDPLSGKWVQKGTAEAAGLGGVQKGFDVAMDWDRNVLKVAGKDIDFVSLHWYVGDTTEASHWKDLDNGKTLMKPEDELSKVLASLGDLFKQYCGQNIQNMQLLVTEMGVKPWMNVTDPSVLALLAADSFLTLIEDQAANIDWGGLQQSFLTDEEKAQPVYFATQLVRQMANLNDKIVNANSNNSLLAVHASLRSDGRLGLILINKDPKNSATVRVTITGINLTTSGIRFDFGKANSASQYAVAPLAAKDLGNNFSVTVPSYTITDLLIPKAQ